MEGGDRFGGCEFLLWVRGDVIGNAKDVGVSKNRGTPKSSTLIRFSIINHPFWGTPIFGNTHICRYLFSSRYVGEYEYHPFLLVGTVMFPK